MQQIIKFIWFLLIVCLGLLRGVEISYAQMTCGSPDWSTTGNPYPLYDSTNYTFNNFPMLNERMYLYYNSSPTGDDIFNPVYGVSRQYYFWYLFGSSWINTYRASFSLTDWGSTSFNLITGQITTTTPSQDLTSGFTNAKTTWRGSLPGYIVCLARVTPGQSCPDNGSNQDRRTRICGYVMNIAGNGCNTSNALGFSMNHATIGCIHEHLKPAPPPFNIVLLSNFSPKVDTQAPGSTFMQPQIRLTDGRPSPTYLTLTYFYSGTEKYFYSPPTTAPKTCDSFPTAANIPGIYCAVIDPLDPTQVCACMQGQCPGDPSAINPHYMGCIARPTPMSSNLKIVASYSPLKNADGTITPRVAINYLNSNANGDLFVNGTNVQVPYNSSTGTYHYNNSDITLDALMAAATLATPFTPAYATQVLRDYYINPSSNQPYYVNDVIDPAGSTSSIYPTLGLAFSPYIPKIVNGVSPIIKYIIDPFVSGNCTQPVVSTTIQPSNTTGFPATQFIALSQDRNRVEAQCTSSYPTYKQCTEPLSYYFPSSDADVNYYYCTGTFKNTAGGQICLSFNSTWPTMSTELSNYHQLCANIPAPPPVPGPTCPATLATTQNGYVAWPNITVASGQTTQSVLGSCDATLGLELRQIYTAPPLLSKGQYCNQPSVGGPGPICDIDYIWYPIFYTYALQTFNTMVAQALSQNRNLLPFEINYLNGAFQYGTITSISVTPSKICNADGTSTVNNGCVYQAGCSSTSSTNALLGFVNWGSYALASGSTQTGVVGVADTHGSSLSNIQVPGKTCANSNTPVTTATRICNIYWKQSLVGGNTVSVYQDTFWSDVNTNQAPVQNCLKANGQ